MTLDRLQELLSPHGLFVMGAFHTGKSTASERGVGTTVLAGAGPQCWENFKGSEEYRDGQTNPLDRWSKRVVGAIAKTVDAVAQYPSDGPPYAPFIAWALETGRFFPSPTGMLVHDRAGLMISIRGALIFAHQIPLPRIESPTPCLTCTDRPCGTVCPVGALSADHAYDVPTCKSYLDTSAGSDCLSGGCLARRACPVSQSFDRDPEQSAFHMRAFKG